MGSGQSIEDEIFNLRLASKQLLRQSQQCSKAEKDERLKVSGGGRANTWAWAENVRVFDATWRVWLAVPRRFGADSMSAR